VKKRDGEFIKWIEMKLPGSAMALPVMYLYVVVEVSALKV